MIRVRCSSCSKTFTVGEEQAGRSVPCRYCTQPVEIESNSDFADFAAPAPRFDPRAELRKLDAQLEQERQTAIFLGLSGLGTLIGAATAVNLQPGVESYVPAYAGAFLVGALAGGLVPTLTTFLAAGGGRTFRSLFGAIPKVKDPAALMRVVTWVAVLGFVCGTAAGAATGVAYAHRQFDVQGKPLAEQRVDGVTSLLPAYLGSVAGVLPALAWRWRARKETKAG